jgi:hypothetical protein
MISHERAELINFINTGDPKTVGNYFARTTKVPEDIQNFYGPEFDMASLIAVFRSDDPDKIELSREFLDKYFDHREGKIPVSQLPFGVRRSSSVLEAKDNFKSAVHSLARGSVTKGTIDLTAATLSAFGLTVRERQLTMALFSSSTAVGLVSLVSPAQAAISPEDIQSAINDFNASSYSQSADTLGDIINDSGIEMPYEGEFMLSPYLAQKLKTHPETHAYIALIVDAAEENGLDPVLFANQLFRETNHFRHSVIYGPDVSPAGAMGFGQFMSYTGPSYGLYEEADYFNPQKAIYAAARMMSDLTEEYNGDQVLAMVAYNGGEKAIEFVEKELGKSEITGKEWLDFMDARYEEIGVTKRSAWHVETREYIADITGQNWDKDYRNWAYKLQGDDPIQYVERTILGNPASAAINAAAPAPNNG